MTPEELISKLTALVDGATESFSAAARAAQRDVLNRIELLMSQVEFTGELIKPSAANLKLLRTIDREIRNTLMNSGYAARGQDFIENFSTIGGLQDQYFSGLAEAFAPSEAIFNRIRNSAISLTEESLMGAGLDSQFIEPIRKILNDNIVSGGSFFDMKKQVREFILGNSERLGRLESYSGQITRDSLNQFSRNYHEQIAQGLKLNWFLYRGGFVKDTRPFCAERAGKYYHRTEVERWPNQKWAGKIPGTTASTIYVYAGGFMCQHFIVAVHEAVVPASDRARVAA